MYPTNIRTIVVQSRYQRAERRTRHARIALALASITAGIVAGAAEVPALAVASLALAGAVPMIRFRPGR